MNKEDRGRKIGQIIAKAWADDAYKQRLLKDAGAVLKEAGVDIPDGQVVRAVENTDKLFHLVLPPRPATGELSDDDLDIAGGGWSPCKALGKEGKVICV
jgi:hypothetical protein